LSITVIYIYIADTYSKHIEAYHEHILETANAIGLSDGRVRQIVNKFKTEEINTANLIPESLQLYNVWNRTHTCNATLLKKLRVK
jgi:hypothetical protein